MIVGSRAPTCSNWSGATLLELIQSEFDDLLRVAASINDGHGSATEILAHIAPIAFRHINFHGVYRFPLERYLDRLIPSAPGRRAVGM